MFANMGVESEHRAAQMHATGRRHAPREMTAAGGAPTYYTAEATTNRRASEEYRQQQVQNANAGPSFMDQMFDKADKKQTASAQAPQSHGTGLARAPGAPKDQLNVFSWNTNGNANAPQTGAAPPAAVNAPGARQALPAQTAQQQQQRQGAMTNDSLHRADAEKFERNSQGHFLVFSDAGKAPQLHTGKKMDGGVAGRSGKRGTAGSVQAPYATNEAAVGTAAPNGQAQPRRGRRGAPAQHSGDGATVAGFKGMGEQCREKPTGRRTGKAEPSQVFAPTVDAEEMYNDVPPAQQRALPDRPAWLQDDANVASYSKKTNSVRFEDEGPYENEGHNEDIGYADDGYDEYNDHQQAYSLEQQQQQQRRMMLYQQRGSNDDGNRPMAY